MADVFEYLEGVPAVVRGRRITVARIQAEVCEAFGLKPKDMISVRRPRRVARPRQVAMFLARKLTPMSFPEIGHKFGNRDHATVWHAYHKVIELMECDEEFASRVLALEARLKAPELVEHY